MRIKYFSNHKVTEIFFIVTLLLLSNSESISQKYSIDQGELKKSGRIGLKYRIEQYKSQKEYRLQKREDKRYRRFVKREKRKNEKQMQTKATRKRMQNLRKSSKRINEKKPQIPKIQQSGKIIIENTILGFNKTRIFIRISFNKISFFFSSLSSKKRKKSIWKD